MTSDGEHEKSIPAPFTRVHTTTLISGIQPSPKFAKKRLASYAVNVGTKCGQHWPGTWAASHGVLRAKFHRTSP